MYGYICSFHFFSFFFSFWGFSVYKMQICFGFKNIFFFKYKLHAGQILNFGRYLPKHPKTPEINRNDPKFFQSRIGTPWTKFLESPLAPRTHGPIPHAEEYCSRISNEFSRWEVKESKRAGNMGVFYDLLVYEIIKCLGFFYYTILIDF